MFKSQCWQFFNYFLKIYLTLQRPLNFILLRTISCFQPHNKRALYKVSDVIGSGETQKAPATRPPPLADQEEPGRGERPECHRWLWLVVLCYGEEEAGLRRFLQVKMFKKCFRACHVCFE